MPLAPEVPQPASPACARPEERTLREALVEWSRTFFPAREPRETWKSPEWLQRQPDPMGPAACVRGCADPQGPPSDRPAPSLPQVVFPLPTWLGPEQHMPPKPVAGPPLHAWPPCPSHTGPWDTGQVGRSIAPSAQRAALAVGAGPGQSRGFLPPLRSQPQATASLSLPGRFQVVVQRP